MFRVPTYLAPSSIHGIGVYTPSDIPSGTVLWDFDPEVDWVFSEAEMKQFPERYRPTVLSYCYVDDDGRWILCGDNARFMNHSDEPNCDDSGIYTVALRDISAGEELTCDYRTFDRLSREDPTLIVTEPAPAPAEA